MRRENGYCQNQLLEIFMTSTTYNLTYLHQNWISSVGDDQEKYYEQKYLLNVCLTDEDVLGCWLDNTTTLPGKLLLKLRIWWMHTMLLTAYKDTLTFVWLLSAMKIIQWISIISTALTNLHTQQSLYWRWLRNLQQPQKFTAWKNTCYKSSSTFSIQAYPASRLQWVNFNHTDRQTGSWAKHELASDKVLEKKPCR